MEGRLITLDGAPEMSSGWLGARRNRFDMTDTTTTRDPNSSSTVEQNPVSNTGDQRLSAGIARTRDYLLGQQHQEGYWVGELEGDTILESEYILLLTFLNREGTDTARMCANYMLEQQLPDGGWAIYPGGPLEISASVKAYLALKITGQDPNSEPMTRAREAILAAGGAEKVNSFTRYYLALLGILHYNQCPAVPPELMLIPRWMPFNIYEMSAWSRTILVPLSLLWAYRPVRDLPQSQHIDELFLKTPQDLSICMDKSEVVDDLTQKTWIDWDWVFRQVDRTIKIAEKLRLKPLRKIAIRKASQWMIERFEGSDGLGAIFPPIVWSIVALKCLGFSEESPEIRRAMGELEALMIPEGDTIRLQPCKSPVWDTAIATIALRDAGVSRVHPAIRKSCEWLLSKEVKQKGDWSVLHPKAEVGGWFFEFNNEFYPDVDDTCMVVMALARCLPGSDSGKLPEDGWNSQYLLGEWSPHAADADAAAVVSGRSATSAKACQEVETASPMLNAIWRGAKWLLAMQSRDGGWGAFDADNDRELFTRVPFADHNAMIDPSTADITARIVEMFAHLNITTGHPAIQKALDFVWKDQEPDHAWYGRWGVNYIYGTWQCVVGLTKIGIPASDPRIQAAADWLKSKQQDNGGWGETPRSYDEPELRGQGPTTASQTAWALIGLIAADQADSESARRGVEYLLDTQQSDGTWDEPWYTGTGFPRVFYLKYHLYCIYFPLMALGRYAKAMEKRKA